MKWLAVALSVIGAFILVNLINFGIVFSVIFIGNFACEWFMGTELLTTAQIAVASVIVVLFQTLFLNHNNKE